MILTALRFYGLFTVYLSYEEVMSVTLFDVNGRNEKTTTTITTKKSRHIQIDHKFYCSIYPTSNATVSLKDGFAVWLQSQKKDFLPIIYY